MKLLLLYGGNSNEHEVSCLSIKNIVDNIDKNLFDFTTCYITKENEWYVVNKEYKKTKKIKNIIKFIQKYHCVFSIIHGSDGEDGKLQSLFEIFDIKYVGCNHVSSMLCMDKKLTKMILKENSIPVTPEYKESDIKEYPVIVKPSNSGSSIGVSKVEDENQIDEAIKEALKYDNNFLIEKFINGLELECSVIEIDDYLYVSTIGQINSANSFYDYEAKYISDSKITIPAQIDEDISFQIKEYARKAFKALKCKGFARIDFFYDGESIYLNEINTLPGFTNISMFSKLLNYDGITTKDIINALVHSSLKDE